MKKLHFKREGISNTLLLTYEGIEVHLIQGKNPKFYIFRNNKLIYSNKDETTTQVKEILQDIEYVFNEYFNLKVEIEEWIEAEFPGASKKWHDKDINILKCVKTDGSNININTDDLTIEDAISKGIDIQKTWKYIYPIDKIEDIFINPCSEILSLTVTDFYLLVRTFYNQNNALKKIYEFLNINDNNNTINIGNNSNQLQNIYENIVHVYNQYEELTREDMKNIKNNLFNIRKEKRVNLGIKNNKFNLFKDIGISISMEHAITNIGHPGKINFPSLIKICAFLKTNIETLKTHSYSSKLEKQKWSPEIEKNFLEDLTTMSLEDISKKYNISPKYALLKKGEITRK